MKHWNIGQAYFDHKRQLSCELVAISPYKSKSGSYLDFKYSNGKYIRQSAAKALSRFEAAYTGPAKKQLTNDFLLDLFDSATNVIKTETSQVDTSNVIYVDFINRRRVA